MNLHFYNINLIILDSTDSESSENVEIPKKRGKNEFKFSFLVPESQQVQTHK